MFKKIKNELIQYEGLQHMLETVETNSDKLDNIYKYGMVLLGPDSFIQREVIDILEFFIDNGFELVSLKTKFINRTESENLFLPSSSCVKCGNLKWWMIQDSAEQGVFCSAIFYHDKADLEHNCLKMLNSLKGTSNPIDNKAGVVRYDFSAINVCLNLIHIPDTYGAFFKDISPFYSVADIVKIINRVQKQNLELKKFELFLLQRTTEKYSFEMIAYKIRYLLSSLLEDEDEIKIYYMQQYNKIVNILDRKKRIGLVKENIKIETEYLENIIKKTICNSDLEEKSFEKILDKIYILRLLKIFTIPELYKCYKRDFFLELKVLGIMVDDFEKLILNTSLIQWKE